MTTQPPDGSAPNPAAQIRQWSRHAEIDSTRSRLTRRLGPVRGFPGRVSMQGRFVEVSQDPELILLVDLIRPAEGEYRFRHCHDVICQVAFSHEDAKWMNNVNVFSSRSIPTTAASVVAGSTMPDWSNLEEVDDVVCAALSPSEVRAKFGESINAFSARWVTEYSLKSIGSLKDAAIADALRARDQPHYTKLLGYLDRLPGVDAETIRNVLKTALVAPDEVAELLARAPPPANREGAQGDGSFERTMEIRSERAQRDKA